MEGSFQHYEQPQSSSSTSLPVERVKTENPTRLCEDALMAMSIRLEPQNVQLPPIREMLATDPDAHRRGSTSSFSSWDDLASQASSTSANRRLAQVYGHVSYPVQGPVSNVAESYRAHPYLPSPRPSASPRDSPRASPRASPVPSSAALNSTGVVRTKRSRKGRKPDEPRNPKAQREYEHRLEAAYLVSDFQAELFNIRPNFAKLAIPMPGKTGLSLLKSNNTRKEDDDPRNPPNPLLHNKNDTMNAGTCALRDSRQLLEQIVELLNCMGLQEVARAIALAASQRGCVDFELLDAKALLAAYSNPSPSL